MGQLSRLLGDGLNLLKQRRYAELSRRAWRRLSYLLPLRPPPLATITPFESWGAQNSWTERAQIDLLDRLAKLGAATPRVAVVVDATGSSSAATARTLLSLRPQAYLNRIAVCVVGDPSDHALAVRAGGAVELAVLTFERKAGETLSQTLNRAVAEARCDILLFVRGGDMLSPAAVGEIALEFALHPQTDYVYCDDDAIDERGLHIAARFKSAWAPERILWPDAFGEMIAVSQRVFQEAGGFHASAYGDLYGEFKCRLAALSRRCARIPTILHHRHSCTPQQPFSSPSCRKEILRASLRHAGFDFRDELNGALSVAPKKAESGSDVAVVLWGIHGQPDLSSALTKLVKFPERCSEIYVVSLASLTAQSGELPRSPSFVRNNNLSDAVNAIARSSSAQFLLLLHGATTLPQHEWLDHLVGAMAFPGADIAGLFRLDGEGRTPSSGQGADKLSAVTDGYTQEWVNERGQAATPCAMVSAYCLIARRAALLELGGLDANVFPGDFADADYCARAAAAGRRVIHLPVSGSFPPASSGPTDTRALLAFRSRHRNTRDPWLNPNLREDNARINLVPRRVIRSKPSPFGALFFSHTLNMEGAPYSQYELATCLRRTGVVIPQVVAPSDGPLLALYRQNDIPVHIEPRLRPKYWAPSEVDLSVQVSRDLINATGASMVHANTLMTFTAIEAAHRTGCPSVWNPRESAPWNKFYRFLDRGQVSRALSCFQYPYRVVFVAQATLQLWSRFDTHHNFMVIRNGLDLSRLAGAEKQISKADARRSLSIGEDEILALSIGTVCARKGQRDIPAALGQLPAPLANRVKLLLVGDEPGPYSTALHRDIERLPNPWNSRISVVRTAQDVGRFYRAADLFLLNSRSESYPRVLLEAMAFELPIIATPVFGVREQVVEHVNGVFYPPGDTAALALLLRELVEDTHLLRELAANSRLVLSSLPTFEEMADQYATIFREAFYTK